MSTIKSYTDLEQSRNLINILPLESADMYYILMPDGVYNHIPLIGRKTELAENTDIPCWSLAVLLDILPVLERKGYQKAKPRLLYDVDINKWIVDSHVYTTDAYDNQIDACIDMILKLNELNLLLL
jgi:hypothetical protein